MDTIEKNKNTVTAFIDTLFTKGDLGAVDKYFAEDFVNHDPPFGGSADREGMRRAGALFRVGCPDWHSDANDLTQHQNERRSTLVGEGDLVVEHSTAGGTHAARPG
jgi:hypothetical protein